MAKSELSEDERKLYQEFWDEFPNRLREMRSHSYHRSFDDDFIKDDTLGLLKKSLEYAERFAAFDNDLSRRAHALLIMISKCFFTELSAAGKTPDLDAVYEILGDSVEQEQMSYPEGHPGYDYQHYEAYIRLKAASWVFVCECCLSPLAELTGQIGNALTLEGSKVQLALEEKVSELESDLRDHLKVRKFRRMVQYLLKARFPKSNRDIIDALNMGSGTVSDVRKYLREQGLITELPGGTFELTEKARQTFAALAEPEGNTQEK